MTDQKDEIIVVEMGALTRYLSPCGMIIVLASMAIELPEAKTIALIIQLLAFSIFFNIGSSYLAKRFPSRSRQIAWTRLPVNFALNIIFAWILGPRSSTIWLLFVLMPLGMAVYNNFTATLLAGIVSAATLVAVHHFRGVATWNEIGSALVHSSFIIFLSLFVNKQRDLLLQAARRTRS